MVRKALIDCFQDTLSFAEAIFQDKIDAARKTGKVCSEGFVSSKLRGSQSEDWHLRRLPEISYLPNLKNNTLYIEHRKMGPYFGRQFSVLGDSISTLDGYNPKGYHVFYTDVNCRNTLVYEYGDTWWGKVIDFFGGELLVNNSWSGSRVTKLPGSGRLFPSGCSDERTSSLHIRDTMPDIIIVYLGINDWAGGVDVRGESGCGKPLQEYFEEAYVCMLGKLQANYPNAEIWCCTLCSTFMSDNQSFVFPKNYAGKHIDEYNRTIRHAAAARKCRIIDLDQYDWPYDSVDGTHPVSAGMDTLAMMVIREMGDESVRQMFDCLDHTYGSDGEYVMIPPDITAILYSDTIHLTQESTGWMFSIQKPLIRAGRHSDCELQFDSSMKYIARFQASFLYERNSWFLRDENSTNGTWLNGQKLKADVKYQLKSDDRIDFAHSDLFIFEMSERV